MHPQPSPDCYLHASDGAAPFRLLTDDGRPEPTVSTEQERLLAELAAAIHAKAWRLSEAQLRAVEQFIALQRWRR